MSPISIKRVLLIHPYGIGDALFMTPVIRALKENGVEQIDLLLGSRTREIFENNPHVDRIYKYDKSKPISLGLFYELFRNRYHAALDFTPTAHYAWISLLFFWIPKRVGFNFKKRGFFLTHKVELPNGFCEKPASEYYMDLVSSMGLERSRSMQSDFFLTHDDKISADAFLQRLAFNDRQIIAVAPGGGESWGKDARLKHWPISNFSGLLEKIRAVNPNSAIFIFGSKGEYSLGEKLKDHLSVNEIYNLCGKTELRITAALLKKSCCLIANDSGLVHLAHAIGVPLVSIYGPVDPLVYGPYPRNSKSVSIFHQGPSCRPCYQRFRYQAQCAGVECLTQLSAEEVFAKISFLTCEHVS